MPDLKKQRGRVLISRVFFEEIVIYKNNYLRALFSNFFPFAIDVTHDKEFYDNLVYVGVSPHFREIEEGDLIPTYIIMLRETKDKTTEFEKVIGVGKE